VVEEAEAHQEVVRSVRNRLGLGVIKDGKLESKYFLEKFSLLSYLVFKQHFFLFQEYLPK